VSTARAIPRVAKDETMVKSHSILHGVAFAIIFSSSLAAKEVKLSTVVATVAGTEITIAHMLDVKRQLPEQYESLEDSVLFNGIIDQLLQQELLASSITEDPSWLAIAMQNQRRNLLSSVVINDLRANSITEDILKNTYAAKYPAGAGEQEYKASHILVETEQRAKDLLALLDGGTDFGGLAIEHSTGPSAPSGGDLGWFGKGQMVAPFESAVIGMEAGTYTGPVKTQFGYHLIFLNDRRETSPPSFEDVRGEIEVEIQNAAVEAHLRGLMANADVLMPTEEIDPSILSILDFTSKL
jgi:peptidyl-prolyl cis-trans isomerase C